MNIVPEKIIVLGMNTDKILIYNYNQTEVRIIDKNAYEKLEGTGDISCVEIAKNLKVIVAGYNKGWIILWEISSRKSLKIIQDLYTT